MENRRYIWFAISIGFGLILGLILGWSVFPRKAGEMPLKELRMDYKADYVLMVATIYQKEMDYDAALLKLAVVDDDVIQLVKDVKSFADEHYSTVDIQVISQLQQALLSHQGAIFSGRAAL